MRAWILLWDVILFQPDLAAASGFLPPQNQHGGMAGTVRSPSGEGLPGVTVEASNLLNANTILRYNNRYTPSWPAPTAILTARFVDFGVQVDF